ncbi:MAG: thymidylate synthase [Nanoarchaeota archaeon]
MKFKNADLAYSYIIKNSLENGNYKKNRTGIDTISTFITDYRLDLSLGFTLLTTKKIDGYRWNSLIHEFLWYLSGEDHIRNLREKTKIWDSWADEQGNLDTAYGRYWRKFPSAQINKDTGKYEVTEIDQIAHVIKLLKTDPNSRRMVVQAWEPGNAASSKLPPCHYSFVFNVQGDKLNVHMTQRSGDVALGIPFNIAAYTILCQTIAQETNFRLGEFGHTIIDSHIYCGRGERGEFYQKNLNELKEKIRNVKNKEDYLEVKKWIEDNAPEESEEEKGFDHVPGLLLQSSREPKNPSTLEINKKSIDDLVFEDFKLLNYECHGGIKFKVAA